MREARSFVMRLGVLAVVFAVLAICAHARLDRADAVAGSPLPDSLRSARVLFSAHATEDSSTPLKLFVCDEDGSSLKQLSGSLITGSENFAIPDVARSGTGAWRIAWGDNGLRVWDSATRQTVAVDSVLTAARADLSADASTMVFQGGTPGLGLNIWKSAWDGGSLAQITNVTQSTSGEWNNAEWPYFIPGTGEVFFFATYGGHFRHVVNTDGSGERVLPAPGGDTVSHAGMKVDGTEFVNPDNLTSYMVSSGATGTLDDLKHTTTMMSQVASLGLDEVSPAVYGGQGDNGTFALSVDWSKDSRMLVFDALVWDRILERYGIAVFTYDVPRDKLRLIYGPEPWAHWRTRDYRYSQCTPKWIPDAFPPVTSLSITPPKPKLADGWYAVSPKLTLAADEPGATYYRWDTGNWAVYSGRLTAPSGIHTLWYYSIDNDDNVETAGSRTFKVSAREPH